LTIEKACGIVIRLVDYSETSQIAAFLTDRFGKVSAIAKGSKRAKSSTGGALDMLTLNEIVFSASASGGLATLREARTIAQYPGIRATTERYYAALYFAELSDAFTEAAENTAEHFNLLVSALEALSEGKTAPAILAAFFDAHALKATGLAPNLVQCVRCGSDPESRARPQASGHETPKPPAAVKPPAIRISLSDGGLLCRNCPGGVPIDRGSLAALRRVFASTTQTISRLRLPKQIQSDVEGVLSAFVVYNARRVPRMMRYLRGDFDYQWRKWSAGVIHQST